MFNVDAILREYMPLPKKHPWRAYNYYTLTHGLMRVSPRDRYDIMVHIQSDYYLPCITPVIEIWDIYKLAIQQEIVALNIMYHNPHLYTNLVGDFIITNDRGRGIEVSRDEFSMESFRRTLGSHVFKFDTAMLTELEIGEGL